MLAPTRSNLVYTLCLAAAITWLVIHIHANEKAARPMTIRHAFLIPSAPNFVAKLATAKALVIRPCLLSVTNVAKDMSHVSNAVADAFPRPAILCALTA